jgi:hypothetical protein
LGDPTTTTTAYEFASDTMMMKILLENGGTKRGVVLRREGERGELLSFVFVLESLCSGQGASCKLCERRKERKIPLSRTQNSTSRRNLRERERERERVRLTSTFIT